MDSSSTGQVAETKRHHKSFMIRLVKEKPLGFVGAIITLLLLLTGIFANVLAPYGMNETHTADTLMAPSTQYWLGTDNLGRDMLSRIIFGARISMIVGLASAVIGTSMAVALGMVSGYIGGKFDLVVQRFVDAQMCFPSIIFLMVLMSVIGSSMLNLILAMGIFSGIVDSRVIRSATIGIRENMYVQAAVAIGGSPSRIIVHHILPNITAPIIILFSLQVPGIILAEASLSFLGFGVPPPDPSWGGMLSGSGRSYMYRAPWMVIWPGLALGTVVYGINMFGDAVRDLLDPRLRGGVGRYGVRVEKEKK